MRQTIVVHRDDYAYTRQERRKMIGRAFPMEDIHGKVTGEGRVVATSLIPGDPLGLAVTIEVPDHLSEGLEFA